MMCDHKNLKTINDMLICKDCGQQLPLSFLKDRGKKETENENPAPDVQHETPPEATDADPAPVVQSETPPETGDEQEPEQEIEQETDQENEQEPDKEPAGIDENPAENKPVELKTDKPSSAKKPRKNAKKGA